MFAAPADGAGYALFALIPALPHADESGPRDSVLVLDRSYSMLGEVGARQLRLLRALVESFSPQDRVLDLTCDSTCQTAADWSPASSTAAARIVSTVAAVAPGGSSDLGEAMHAASQALAQRKAPSAAPSTRVIYLGDGQPTVGELDPGRLAEIAARELRQRGSRLITVGVGSGVDAVVLGAVAAAGGGRFHGYLPGESARTQALEAVAGQYGSVLENVQLTLPEGLSEIAPATVHAIHQAAELLVTARVPSGQARIRGPLSIRGTDDAAVAAVRNWLARDPKDEEAVERLAELLARAGQQEPALRVLESVLDLAPADAALHLKLARIYQDQGLDRRACAHVLSLAALAPADAGLASEAERCRVDGGRWERSAAPLSGRVRLRASWRGGADVDLALVDPDGQRKSWLNRDGRVRFDATAARDHETVAILGLPSGTYRVELVRARDSGTATVEDFVDGQGAITGPDGRPELVHFQLGRKPTTVAELRLRHESRLVPADR